MHFSRSVDIQYISLCWCSYILQKIIRYGGRTTRIFNPDFDVDFSNHLALQGFIHFLYDQYIYIYTLELLLKNYASYLSPDLRQQIEMARKHANQYKTIADSIERNLKEQSQVFIQSLCCVIIT